MAQVRLPRVLEPAARNGLKHEIEGGTLIEVLDRLFAREPALKGHLLDEQGSIRHHVLIFVDGTRADLQAAVGTSSEVRVLQAVSGG